MDPLNRRHVWAFIEQFKKGRVIVLTTHSMEEADILGDEIAIMATSKLRAIGTSIHLKNKFGTGYRLSAVCDERRAAAVQADLAARLPGLTLADDSAGALMFTIPRDALGRVPDLVRYLESSNNGAEGSLALGPEIHEKLNSARGRWLPRRVPRGVQWTSRSGPSRRPRSRTCSCSSSARSTPRAA